MGFQYSISFRNLINYIIALTILFELTTCDANCNYYPNYPDNSSPLTISCSNGCCGGNTTVSPSNACCPSSSKSWIAYPIVALSLLIVGSIIFAFVCIKCKTPKKIKPSNIRLRQMGNNNMTSQSNFNQESYPDVYNLSRWDQAPPPKYDEIEIVRTDFVYDTKPPVSNNFDSGLNQLNANPPLQELPGTIKLAESESKTETDKL